MGRNAEDKRVTATLDRKTYDKLAYIAENKGISVNAALKDAIILMIRYENEDYYPLAKLESARINQLADLITLLSSNVTNLEKLTMEGFSSLINITKGDNYLFEEEDV